MGGGFTGGVMFTGGTGTGRAAIGSVSRGFVGGVGIVGPSGLEPSVVPPSGSAETAGDSSRGGSGGDQVMTGGVGAGSTVGDWIGGTGIGTGGAAGVAVVSVGASGITTGARGVGDCFSAAGAPVREGAAAVVGAAARDGAAGLGASARDGGTGPGCATGAGRGGPAEADSLIVAEPGTGNTSREFRPGGMLAIQMRTPSTMTWKESEPDMQTLSLTAGNLLSGAAGQGSGSPGVRVAGLDRAGHGGKAGSLMCLFLPREPPLSYGLLRLSETSPAGARVSARPGEAARAGVDAGTSRSTGKTGEVPFTAGSAEGRASAPLSEPTGAGCSVNPAPTGRRAAGKRGAAGRGSPNPAPAPMARNPLARSDASRRPITEPV
jgi:hypothetical protein